MGKTNTTGYHFIFLRIDTMKTQSWQVREEVGTLVHRQYEHEMTQIVCKIA